MRILVVEDETAMAVSLTWGLQAEGYVVDVATTARTACGKARETPHDVIVLDVISPAWTATRSANDCASTASGPRS